jgi:hypothetical protein
MYYCQHQMVFQVEYGRAQSDLSGHLMKAILIQNIHKDLGMPITDECLHRSTNPTWWWRENGGGRGVTH